MTSNYDTPQITQYTDPLLTEQLTKLFGAPRAFQLFKSLRSVVHKYFFRLTASFQDDALEQSRQLTSQSLLEKGWKTYDHNDIPEAFFVHSRGPFNLTTLECERKVIVDKRAAESIFQGANLFVPGVLSAKGVSKGDIVQIVSPQNVLVGIGRAVLSKRQMHTLTHGIAVKVSRTVYETPSLRDTIGFKQGLVYPQSFPALLTSRILAPDPSSDRIIVDLCAAPGGKSSHILQLMNGKGKLIAVDNSKNRIHVLNQTLERLNQQNVTTIHGNAIKLVTQFKFKADKILLDPPCSALGVRPKLYEEKSYRDVLNLSKYQMVLLKAASKLLKDQGILVYSTCTLTAEENENIVNFAIRELDLHVVDQNYRYGAPGLPLSHLEFPSEQVQRFYPDIHDSPGFFIAKLQKNPQS